MYVLEWDRRRGKRRQKHTSIVRQSNVFDLFVHCVTTRGRMAVVLQQTMHLDITRTCKIVHIYYYVYTLVSGVPSRLPSRGNNNGAPHIQPPPPSYLCTHVYTIIDNG